MQIPRFESLGNEIYCIDALYRAPDVACCYLVGSDGEYAFVETGTARSVPNILATIERLGISDSQVRYVIPTHVHLDHAGAAGQLMQRFGDATLLIHPRGARHMIDPARLVASAAQVYGDRAFQQLYGEILPVPAERVTTLEDGARVELGRRRLRVRHTRGHAEHHFCLFDEGSRSWFSGDMFGISYPYMRFPDQAFVVPATTPTQFDPALYTESVLALAAEQPRQLYLTHYGALPFADTQVAMLCRQLQGYARLADEGQLDADALARGVGLLTEREMAPLAGHEAARDAALALRLDLQLNAQGIAWWRDHR